MPAVLPMFDQDMPPLSEDCHLTIFPVYPFNVSVPLFDPLQTVLLPEIVPPAEAEAIVMAAVPE